MSAHIETKLQIEIVDWWKFAYVTLKADHESVLFHVPNGGARGKREAAILQAMGVRAGIPDLILLQVRQGFGALLLECKAPTGTTRPEQKELCEIFLNGGYLVAVVRSFEAAEAIITDYMLAGKMFSRSTPEGAMRNYRWLLTPPPETR